MTPGSRVGRYVIESVLGKGAMGTVYRATDTMLRRAVALKVVDASAAPDPGATIARFLREARAAASLQHSNIVSVFDVGEEGERAYLAMELVEGKTLRERLTEASSLVTRMRWLVDVARALSAAHALGLVHRDVKPDNVLIDPDETAKLTDFGIVKRRDAGPDSYRTGTGELFGTPDYMAPEQWATADVDATADQYAWGVMAYEVLSRRVLPTGRPPPLQSIAPEVPDVVAACVAKASAHAAKDRHASMDSIIEILAPYCTTADRKTATVEELAKPVEPTERTKTATMPLPPLPVAEKRPAKATPRSSLSRLLVFGIALGVTVTVLGAFGVVSIARRSARSRASESPTEAGVTSSSSSPTANVPSAFVSAEPPPVASAEELTLDAGKIPRRAAKPPPPRVGIEPRVVVGLDTVSCKGVPTPVNARIEADKAVKLVFASQKIVKCFQSRVDEGDVQMHFPVRMTFSAVAGTTTTIASSGPPKVVRCLAEIAQRSDNTSLRQCPEVPTEVAVNFNLKCRCLLLANKNPVECATVECD